MDSLIIIEKLPSNRKKKTPLQFIGRSLANLQNATMQKHLRRAHKHKNSSTLKKGWFSDPAYVTIPLILKKKQTFISSKWFILFRGAFYEI